MFKMRILMEVQAPHKIFIRILKKFQKVMKIITARQEESENKPKQKNCHIKGA